MANNTLCLEKDSLSRKRIVSEMDKNFFVEAGAGSGKTTMLVNRMVAMVESGIDISKICAITFTKAAAGEFYDRFQKVLIERSNPGYVVANPEWPGSLKQPDDITRERCAKALQNIDLCFMGTIDSFCSMVLSEHPSEAGIPSDAIIVSDEDAATIYKQQYVMISAGDYGEELQSFAKTFNNLNRGAQNVFVNGISFIMNNRNMHFNFHEVAAFDIDEDFKDKRKQLLDAVKCLVDHPELKYDGNKDSLDAWDRISDSYNAIRRRWSTNFSSVLYTLKNLKKLRLIPEAMNNYDDLLESVFIPGGKGKKPKWYEFASGKDYGLYEKLIKLQYDASMTFLTKCIPVIENAMRENGCLTYFDYLYYLRNMLKKDAEGDGKLIRYIYDRHSYFLIDEFQDTNPLQAEVFFYLSSEHPVSRWSACEPRKGSLFIVGDPKQSIYRFRSADVTSFIKVKKLFEEKGGEILTLSRNFRSTNQLCDYFNRVFSKLLPEETENQSKYESIPLSEQTDKDNGFNGIFTYESYMGQAAQDHPDMSDPVRIADIIERLVGNSQYKLKDEKDKELRTIRYSDFMVITYGKKKLGPIMAELDSRDIPTRVEGDVPFAENEALHEICCIFSAVSDADNSFALYGALTGKLIGLTKEDILQYRADGGTVSLKTTFNTEISPDIIDHTVAKNLCKLKNLSALARIMSPAVLFSRIMDDFRIYQKLPSENLEVVYYALELLRNAENSGQVISLKDGAAFLKNLIAGTSGEERCLSLDANKDCVHMANLHKVKGLEAPIVILAAALPPKVNVTYRMQHGDDSSEGWLFSLESERDESGKSIHFFQTDDYDDEKDKEKVALEAENKRLIYVAATRAKNALIFCKSMKSNDKNARDSMWKQIAEPDLPSIFELPSNGFKQNENDESIVNASDLYKKALESSVFNDRTAESVSYKSETPSRLQVLSKLSESPDQPEQEYVPKTESVSGTETDSEVHYSPALLGTVTHKLLEMLVTTRNKLDVNASVGEIMREYRTPGTERYESDLMKELLKVAETMRNGGYPQTNGLPRDMLETLLSADEVYCEVPFSYMDESEDVRTVWNGVMDVVYMKDGKWHIVDYKTNANGSDLDLRYQEQLNAYVKAFKATTGFDADALTYHIDI